VVRALKEQEIETLMFELERRWSAKYLGLMLFSSILLVNVPTVLMEPPSTISLLRFSSGLRAALLYLWATITFASSFCKDIEQGVMKDEFSNPLRKSVIFIIKLSANFLVIAVVDLLLVIFSSWLAFGSVFLSSAFLVTFAQLTVSFLYVVVSILIGTVIRNTIASIMVPLSIYFLEGYYLLISGSPFSIEEIFLRLILGGDIKIALPIVIVHVGLSLLLLIFSFVFFTRFLELD
jgi:hypothetical protein